ncbi:hypothetical protein J3Q64DRAFT_1876560 [Phycomyces blakesleeanus]|uniref:DUF1838 domain-containing protein n=2 Tax=Phycomyces blakesleeanus TaxID=4837 RepID=A0A163DA77_PHYB8|nr:hypothetical protein PHYBLDRAFT_149080 [Phycomyces blakesleeanus NRRL 1555(-)]OAD69900.1 hypothetical protein PHYBLDRAFT_149080 [Phycomyces blakesleeanus NRRL 1555(-)]|eukprot:XP_018287940.1 hypothetical protein PHYBLDRAFT_149080 [Phycomyces blakesleeanus NRRL 1555(-)]
MDSDNSFGGEFLQRLRYSADPNSETFFEWSGSVFAFLPNQPPKKIFECVGMNVSKAIHSKEQSPKDVLEVTGRELTYYLDPITRKKLTHWVNPWTNECLPVVHIANNPVQMALPWAIKLEPKHNFLGTSTTFTTEIPLFYPNPLSTKDKKFNPYDSRNMYQAGEFFTFTCPTKELNETTIDDVQVNWTRISLFPPFMKMGTSEGYLIYHCTGSKLPHGSTYKDLGPLLVEEIEKKMNAYSHSPAAYDPMIKSVSSWTYFKDNFETYKNDQEIEWPLPN